MTLRMYAHPFAFPVHTCSWLQNMMFGDVDSIFSQASCIHTLIDILNFTLSFASLGCNLSQTVPQVNSWRIYRKKEFAYISSFHMNTTFNWGLSYEHILFLKLETLESVEQIFLFLIEYSFLHLLNKRVLSLNTEWV